MEPKHRVCVDWQRETAEYKQRLSSFYMCTIADNTKHGFVKSGFSCSGAWEVQCMYCRGRIKMQDIKCNPFMRHIEFWPYCPFVQDIERQRCSPAYPEYQELISRIRTYPTWPEHKLQSVNSLAAAGFFYTGPLDRVQCFYCGTALKEWGSEDDPVTVHKTVCPYCVYIHGSSLQFLGISTSIDEHPADVDLLLKNITDDKVVNMNKTQMLGIKTCHPLFKTLSNLGFDEDIIMQEMRIKVLKTGENFKTVHEFLHDVWKRGEIYKQGTFKKITDDVSAEEILAENMYLRETLTCKMCCNEKSSVLFLPCGHLVTCADCACKLGNCIVCEKLISGTVNVLRH